MHNHNEHTCIICTGSNFNATHNISRLEELLRPLFPDIRWGEAVETPAEHTESSSPNITSSVYINRAAEFSTSLTLDELNSALKGIEKEMGRNPGMRLQGIVPIDIDILIYDDSVIRPGDMKRSYVAEALKTLSSQYYTTCS